MRQLKQALASQTDAGVNALLLVNENVPADITTFNYITWNTAYRISIADPFVVNFLQPTLGYSGAQMTALFLLADTFPA
jgi:hypothetical protein